MTRNVCRAAGASALAAALLLVVSSASGQEAPNPSPASTGLIRRGAGAFEGYTLFAPLRSTTTYLVDLDGEVVHRWESDATPGNSVYLLENGHLLRTAKVEDNPAFHGGGEGGRVREIAWDGTVVWEFLFSSEAHRQHHDIEPLPNGNALLVAWERKTAGEALATGRDPALLGDGGMWPDMVVEVKPIRPSGGTIVWEWHAWDHLVQDRNPALANFGAVARHPELIDINGDRLRVRPSPSQRDEQLGRLAQLGYVGRPPVLDERLPPGQRGRHAGGRSSRGGDLLYRWGNPRAWGAGTASDQQLFAQHDVHWIPEVSPGAGHLLCFNNGARALGRAWSSVDEIVPPVDEAGHYALAAGAAFGPQSPVWSWEARTRADFFSERISGVQRLPNGNTLVCAGEQGRLLELTEDGEIVWEFISPFGNEGAGAPDFPGPPCRGGRFGVRPPPHGGLFRATRYAPDYPGLGPLHRVAEEPAPPNSGG